MAFARSCDLERVPGLVPSYLVALLNQGFILCLRADESAHSPSVLYPLPSLCSSVSLAVLCVVSSAVKKLFGQPSGGLQEQLLCK